MSAKFYSCSHILLQSIEQRADTQATETYAGSRNKKGKVTFFICPVDSFAHLILAAHIPLHVGKDSGLVSPQIVIRPKEEHRELAYIMSHLVNIGRYSSRMADLSWPPPGKCENKEENL